MPRAGATACCAAQAHAAAHAAASSVDGGVPDCAAPHVAAVHQQGPPTVCPVAAMDTLFHSLYLTLLLAQALASTTSLNACIMQHSLSMGRLGCCSFTSPLACMRHIPTQADGHWCTDRSQPACHMATYRLLNSPEGPALYVLCGRPWEQQAQVSTDAVRK